jgi:hypothetical protein
MRKFNRFLILFLPVTLMCFYMNVNKAAAVNDLSALRKQVDALPESSRAEKWKKAVLSVSLERAQSSINVGLPDYATELANDIKAAIKVQAESMVKPSTEIINISSMNPVKVKDNNPYIIKMCDGLREELQTPDIPWEKCTSTRNTFKDVGGPYGSRTTASKMQALLWLVANPASPYAGDSEVLTRLLRRVLAYVDAINVLSSTIRAGANIFDDFAIAPASCALREIVQLYPNLLLPCQKEQLAHAMQSASDIMWGKAKDRNGRYANIDLALAYELLNFGLYLRNDTLLAKAKFLMEVQEKNIYPDGAIAYLGSQNESHGYHDTDARYLAGYQEVSKDKKSLELLKKMEWYGPVTSGYLGEFWTVPSWKEMWNSANGRPAGGEWVAFVTGNQYIRTMLDMNSINKMDIRKWVDAFPFVSWYRNDVKGLPLPENYTVFDRNIVGPRAWYGRFNYAASLRPIPNTEPGLSTIMGCQVTEPDFSIQSVVMGIFPRVRLKSPVTLGDGTPNKRAWAWLTSDLKSSFAIGREFSAISASYRLHVFGSSTKDADADWNGRQLWLGLPDRIVGLLEAESLTDQTLAYEVNGVIRVGIGGTATGKPQKMIPLGSDSYRYGDLIITLHQHNYAAVEPVVVPFRIPNAPVTEITLLDDMSFKSGAKQTSAYALGKQYFYLVEIRPSWVKDVAVVKRTEAANGIVSMIVTLSDKSFTVWANISDKSRECGFDNSVKMNGATTSLHISGTPPVVPVKPAPKVFTLLPGQLAVFISSNNPQDHEPGWGKFTDMLTSLNKK